jgi:hypothetical protein
MALESLGEKYIVQVSVGLVVPAAVDDNDDDNGLVRLLSHGLPIPTYVTSISPYFLNGSFTSHLLFNINTMVIVHLKRKKEGTQTDRLPTLHLTTL